MSEAADVSAGTMVESRVRWVVYWRHDEKSAWREYGSEGSEHNARGMVKHARSRPYMEVELRRVTTLTERIDV